MSEEDNMKASFVGWDLRDDGKEQKGDLPKAEWMKFDKQGDYTVRLVGKPVEFLRHSEPFGKKRIITHAEYKDLDPAWKAGFRPRTTNAIHIIDRADGRLKVLEKGRTVFDQIRAYKNANPEVEVCGKESPDFVINVTWPPGDKFQTKYKVTAKAKMNTLTPEEIALIKEKRVDLQSMYKATKLEDIVKAWEEVPAEKRVWKKTEKFANKETTVSSKASAPINTSNDDNNEVSPSNSEDLFDDNARF